MQRLGSRTLEGLQSKALTKPGSDFRGEDKLSSLSEPRTLEELLSFQPRLPKLSRLQAWLPEPRARGRKHARLRIMGESLFSSRRKPPQAQTQARGRGQARSKKVTVWLLSNTRQGQEGKQEQAFLAFLFGQTAEKLSFGLRFFLQPAGRQGII